MLRCRVLCLRTSYHKASPQRCCFSQTPRVVSGHSKWATIKHDKAKNDGAKNKQRSNLAKEIALASKLKGPNPNDNPHLALAIERAKKASVPKALIESAIARGQGVSASGVKLESCTLEAILPPSVAVVIELETDNRLRTLAELRVIVKDHEGNVTPTGYMLERMGRVVLRDGDKALSADDVLEAALDAGAVDVAEGEEHTHVVLTEPASTSGVSEELAASLGAEVESVDIVWSPNEDTKTRLNSDEAAVDLMEFLTALQDVSEVQAVHTNIARGAVSDDVWAELQRRVRV